jgi:hypothetical protein
MIQEILEQFKKIRVEPITWQAQKLYSSLFTIDLVYQFS